MLTFGAIASLGREWVSKSGSCLASLHQGAKLLSKSIHNSQKGSASQVNLKAFSMSTALLVMHQVPKKSRGTRRGEKV